MRGSVTILTLFVTVCSVLAEIQPDACDTHKHVCVGLNQPCTLDGGALPSSCNDKSVCRQCNSDTLTCHQGVCLARLQSEGETCSDENHQFCKPGMSCSGGTCRQSRSEPTGYLVFGDECDLNSQCFGNLRCDSISKVCTLTETSPGSREYLCSDDNECQFGEFCENRGTQRICSPVLPANERLGHACQADRQCGHVLKCLLANPLEQNVAFQKRLCLLPYQLLEGQPCSTGGNDNCAKGLLCDQNSRTCSRPNTAYLGNGCANRAECGRLMSCACPVNGNDRNRCIVDPGVASHSYAVDNFSKKQGWLNCLEEKKCQQQSHNQLGCSWTKCQGAWAARFTGASEWKCQGMSDFASFPAYEGVVYAGAAGLTTSMTTLFALVGVAVALFQ